MENLALIDADSLYFRVCWKTKKNNEIRKNIKIMLDDIAGNTYMAPQKIAIKGPDNWRKLYYPNYKANRKDLEPDMKKALNYAHQYMKEELGAIPSDGMEADDLVSIWASEARSMEIPYIVVGIDKDLLQIPGNHYNFVKKEHKFVDDDTANYNLMVQCLTGDNSDNIPGLKGIGPKKAEKILNGISMDRRWNRIRAAWRGHSGGTPDLSYRLLKMLTSWEEYEQLKRELKTETS